MSIKYISKFWSSDEHSQTLQYHRVHSFRHHIPVTNGKLTTFSDKNRLNIWCACSLHLLFRPEMNNTLTLALFHFVRFGSCTRRNFRFLRVARKCGLWKFKLCERWRRKEEQQRKNRCCIHIVWSWKVHELACLHQRMYCLQDKRKCKYCARQS